MRTVVRIMRGVGFRARGWDVIVVSMTVRANGLSFDVQIGGPEGGPPVLLLHGFPQHAGMWDGVVPALHRAGLRTYAPNQRGYSPGARPSDVDGYPMSDCVADAVAVMDALGIDRADVVGHDWGSVVAWHLAVSHSDRVRTLTAVSVPHPEAVSRARHTDGSDQKERSSYMFLFAQPGKAEETLLADDARRLRRLFNPLPDDVADRYVKPLLEPGALTGALNWYRKLEPPRIGPTAVPVTFIWGNQDQAIGRVAAEGCADFVTGDYRFVELDGVSHWLPDQHPEVVAAEVLDRR
jgi:pimeloyl-ACP methyl ester carboxylesterase